MVRTGPRSAGLVLVLVAASLAVPVGAATEGSCTLPYEACPGVSHHLSKATDGKDHVEDDVPLGSWLGDPVDVAWDNYHDTHGATEAPCRQASDRVGGFGDLGTSKDAGASLPGALWIEGGTTVERSWFMDCDRGALQDDVDWYAFLVKEGDAILAATTNGGCSLRLPGELRYHPCGIPQIAGADGTAVVVAWPTDRKYGLGYTAPRPYMISVSTARARTSPSDRGASETPGLDGVPPTLRDTTERPVSHDMTLTERRSRQVQQTLTETPARQPDAPSWSIALAVIAAVLATLWLYRRITRDEALDNDLRSAILERVRDDPGVTPTELAKDLDVATNTIIYHGRILEELDFLTSERDRQRKRYFAAEGQDRRVQAVQAALRRDGQGDVLRGVLDDPGIGMSDLACRLDRHPSTVKRHADTLIEEGFLEDVGDGTRRRFTVPEEVLDAARRST